MGRAPRLHYLLAFGALGLAGGTFTACVFHEGLSGFTMVLAISTALCAAGVGLAVSQRDRWLLSSLAFGVLGGMANGFLLGMTMAPGAIALFGVPFGAFCSLPFLPALALMGYAGTRYGRARAGTVLAALDRRGLLRATVASIAFAGLVITLAVIQQPEHFRASKTCALGYAAFIALVVLVVVTLADVRALETLLAAASRASRARVAGAAERDVPAPDAGTIDVGVGDARHLEESGAFTFRSAPMVRLALVGDVVAARDAAVRAICLDAVGVVAALAALSRLATVA